MKWEKIENRIVFVYKVRPLGGFFLRRLNYFGYLSTGKNQKAACAVAKEFPSRQVSLLKKGLFNN